MGMGIEDLNPEPRTLDPTAGHSPPGHRPGPPPGLLAAAAHHPRLRSGLPISRPRRISLPDLALRCLFRRFQIPSLDPAAQIRILIHSCVHPGGSRTARAPPPLSAEARRSGQKTLKGHGSTMIGSHWRKRRKSSADSPDFCRWTSNKACAGGRWHHFFVNLRKSARSHPFPLSNNAAKVSLKAIMDDDQNGLPRPEKAQGPRGVEIGSKKPRRSLADLGLTAEQLKAVRRQGFVCQERRGENLILRTPNKTPDFRGSHV